VPAVFLLVSNRRQNPRRLTSLDDADDIIGFCVRGNCFAVRCAQVIVRHNEEEVRQLQMIVRHRYRHPATPGRDLSAFVVIPSRFHGVRSGQFAAPAPFNHDLRRFKGLGERQGKSSRGLDKNMRTSVTDTSGHQRAFASHQQIGSRINRGWRIVALRQSAVVMSRTMNKELSLQMMQMMMGGVTAQSISVAAELGIADLLAEPRSTAQLAEAAHVDSEKLFRLLRFLASLGVFQLDASERWNLTPLGGLLRSDGEGSVRAGARMLGRMSSVLPHLLDNVRSGRCAYNLAFGKPIFEDLAGKPEDAAIFDAAMNSFHGPETDAVLNAYNYEGISVLADIGCGSGAVMVATLRRYPAMRGIFYDQPHVMARTMQNVQAAGLTSRCTFQQGNFFESAPAGADAYTMRHILHDWSDDLCIRILGNIRKVIPASGRLLVIETVVPDGNGASPSKLFDVLMMMFPDGLERSETQFRNIFNASGFRLTGVTQTESPVCVVEARPV
jgi:hypothetical protein